MLNRITELCETIKSCSCKMCSGSFDKDTCIYCGKKDENLSKLEDELIQLLSNLQEINMNTLLNIHSIKDFNIDIVTDILKQNDFESILNNKYSELINKKGDYTNEDQAFMFHFVDNNIDINNFLDILMKELITNKLNLNTSKKMSLLKRFAENIVLSETFFKPHINVTNIHDPSAVGGSFNGYINFDEEYIRECLKKQDYLNILKLIFHECTHTKQRADMKNPKIFSYKLLVQSKEEVIRMMNKSYYNDNYYLYFNEVDARYNGVIRTYMYLESLGIPLQDSIVNKMEQDLVNEKLNMKNEDRKINDAYINVHKIFESILSTVPINKLTQFPGLVVQYKEQDGKLVKKTREELDKDYTLLCNNLSDNAKIRAYEQKELDTLYSFLNVDLTKSIEK